MRQTKHSDKNHFSAWIRSSCNQDLAITDIDFIVRDYKKKLFMILEEKTGGTDWLPKGQEITIKGLDDIFRKHNRPNYSKYVGAYMVIFSYADYGIGSVDYVLASDEIYIKDIISGEKKRVNHHQLADFIGFDLFFDQI